MANPTLPFEVLINEEKMGEFYENLRSFSMEPPTLIIKFHKTINNVECMISENLQDGLAGQRYSDSPEKRAFEFLHGLAAHIGIEERVFRKFLFLKHVLRSAMGVHCIFGLRWRNIELDCNAFFVHLDRANNIVMVSAVYQPFYNLNDLPSDWESDVIREGIQNAIDYFVGQMNSPNVDNELIRRICRDGWVWTPAWNKKRYELRYKVKLTTLEGSYVILIDKDAQFSSYLVDAYDRPSLFQIGDIFGSSWQRLHQTDEDAKPEEISHQPLLRKILLRDIVDDNGQLASKYVSVEDRLSTSWPTITRVPKVDITTHPDRVMAFYHINKMQDYFRQLGLSVLNEYPHLNPLHVVLSANEAVRYVSTEQRIYFSLLREKGRWTHARNSRTVYHECVHAVTDALARMQRQDLQAIDNVRSPQMLQAAAMDEALADYFACSMVAQEGDSLAEYRRLKEDPDGNIAWSTDENQRRSLESGKIDWGIINEFEQHWHDKELRKSVDENTIYEWCQFWARYLWLLRKQLGSEVADVLIANSIFFLNRWSSFGMGVLALLTADRLLFQENNSAVILNTSKIQTCNVNKFYSENGSVNLQNAIDAVSDAEPALTVAHIGPDDEFELPLESYSQDSGDESATPRGAGVDPVGAPLEKNIAPIHPSLDIGDVWRREEGSAHWTKQSL